ncbi:MAG TPA: glycosyl hydrolase family 28-related protein, partial [Planococcus sp. (in: firmicutes)]|nr:glycosyl hydrolase family 28-related protein [Planococcus sp. (in: firmicutes)]
MLKWDDNHHPINNGRLIDMLLGTEGKLEDMTEETQRVFDEIRKPVEMDPVKTHRTIKEKIWSPISTKFTAQDNKNIGFEVDGDSIFPYWKKDLDREYSRLKELNTHAVSVTQFGARGDGRTDSTAAFQKAFGNGGKTVFVPEGIYVVKGLKLPSWTRLVGAGKGKTVIRLHDKA